MLENGVVMRGRSARTDVGGVVQSNASDVSGDASMLGSVHSKRSSRGSHADIESNAATPATTPVHERKKLHLSLPPHDNTDDVTHVVCKQLPPEVRTFCSDANQNVDMTSLQDAARDFTESRSVPATSMSALVDSKNGNSSPETQLSADIDATHTCSLSNHLHDVNSCSMTRTSLSHNDATCSHDIAAPRLSQYSPEVRRNYLSARCGRPHRVTADSPQSFADREDARGTHDCSVSAATVVIGTPITMTSDDEYDHNDVTMPTPELRHSVESLDGHPSVMTSSVDVDSSADDAENDVDADLPPRRRRNANAARQQHLLTSSHSSEHLQRELSLMKCSSDGLSDKELRTRSLRMQLKRRNPLSVSAPSPFSTS